MLSGIPTTDFGEQSTRAASCQDKLHRRLPLIYGLGCPTAASSLLRIKLVASVVFSLSLFRVQIEFGINTFLVHICPGYCKRTLVVQYELGNTLLEALKGNREGKFLFGDCVHALCCELSECIGVITSSYTHSLLSQREFRMFSCLMM